MWKREGNFLLMKPIILTHLSSRSLKKQGSRKRRKGTVRMRINGKAREAGLDFIPHSTTRHTIWVRVKMCMCQVFTFEEGNRHKKHSGTMVTFPSFSQPTTPITSWQ